MKKIKLIITSFFLLISLFSLSSVKADSSSISCSDLSNSVSNVMPSNQIGSLYIKLPKYSSSVNSNLSIYTSPPTIGATCSLVATVNANRNTWVKVADNLNLQQYTEITLDGNGLGAEVYAASAYLLIVTNNACNPNANCDFTDSFGSGYLTPNIISTDTDEIAIYTENPITGIKVKKYDYYDNGKLIYVSNKLNKINQDYLSGGEHSIDITAMYSNGENLHYISKINMGPDWSKWLLIRSTYYKSKTPIKIISLAILGLIILFLILLIYRFISKKIKDRHSHGIDNYTPEDQPPIDPESNIVVG